MLPVCLTWICFSVSLFVFYSVGRLLASFRSGFSHLVPDGTSEVYVKKTKVVEKSSAWRPSEFLSKWELPRDGTQRGDGNWCKTWHSRTASSCLTSQTQHGSVDLQEQRGDQADEEAFEASNWMWCIYGASCSVTVWSACQLTPLCQLLFKGISLQVQLSRESLMPLTFFFLFTFPLFAVCVSFHCEVESLLLDFFLFIFFKPKR